MKVYNNIFVAAGRTGGPLFPAIAIAKEIPNFTPIIVGVRGGFEEKYVQENNFKLLFLPDARLTLLSFSGLSFLELIGEIVRFILMIFRIIKSLFISLYLQIKYRPSAIISAGSFLGVPLSIAAKITNIFRLTNTKIILHQQDSKISLSNKLVAPLAHKITSYFKSSIEQFAPRQCTVIPNPLDYDVFDNTALNVREIDDKILKFYMDKSKPILLVFGGGSGAFAINRWVYENIAIISERFRVMHLTGALQTNSKYQLQDSQHYLSLPFVSKAMPWLMVNSDLIICRAGMSSITELMYLHKNAFLIPMPNSHQDQNAKEVVQYFPTLRQIHTVSKPGEENWITTINDLYPTYFQNISFPNKEDIKSEFETYIQTLIQLLDPTKPQKITTLD
jgi:UDP-N-acetylglucosamine--N-acetylmuramyl-(pentapeptide) pyrophosphoryl-undecaprenol N-acetylglucosamine transferase